MKIQLYSDLHIESIGYYSIPLLESDVIILAGDIDVGLNGIEWAEELTRIHNKPVIYVAGNHEYYKKEYFELSQALRDYASQYERLHYLEKDELIIGDVRILGTTLWTNYFHELGVIERNKNMEILQQALTDHVLIRYNDESFTTKHAYQQNQLAERWLRKNLNQPFEGKTVIVTHHSPSLKCGHREYGLNQFSSGFLSNLDGLVKKADLWLYGHTHCNEDLMIGNCRILSNQKGYPREKAAGNRYRPELVIDI